MTENNTIRVIDEEEYLAEHGFGSPTSFFTIDKMRGNRQLMTQKGVEKFQRELTNAQDEYEQGRKAARDEYRELVKSGAIRGRTRIERLLIAANGHPDKESTQAARRTLKKRGINWEDGKR